MVLLENIATTNKTAEETLDALKAEVMQICFYSQCNLIEICPLTVRFCYS